MKTHHHPNRALSQEEMETRRLRAVPYFKRNWTERSIAKKLAVSGAAVHLWKEAWQKKGVAGLKAGRYGPSPKLSPKSEAVVKKRILEGAEINGFSGDFWTLNRVTKAVKSWTGVLYQERSVWHFLKRLGFSCQKPVKRAVERDEKEIQIWKQKTWAEVKKRAIEMA